MPDLDGIAATRRLTRAGAPVVIVLTMCEDDDSVFAAMRAGAHGYLLKGAKQDEIVGHPRGGRGRGRLRTEIAQRVITHFATGGGSSNEASLPGVRCVF